ncbi:MAG: hypothetical protein LBQ31_01995 [Bacteroidales bacterium]|jgi:hypothetical protein|nr:hypothetical protein [Bacteroidales bacterium]
MKSIKLIVMLFAFTSISFLQAQLQILPAGIVKIGNSSSAVIQSGASSLSISAPIIRLGASSSAVIQANAPLLNINVPIVKSRQFFLCNNSIKRSFIEYKCSCIED